ncbi:hypothetical protein ARUE_c19840 [Arthrobacter sp. Rue61a]|nr:hypothetical protein ARUE_c19840 [Arthrobacter sp. Rue61a]
MGEFQPKGSVTGSEKHGSDGYVRTAVKFSDIWSRRPGIQTRQSEAIHIESLAPLHIRDVQGSVVMSH